MILEFITEKPTNAGAWKAINKLEFTLVQKVLLWLNIVLTYDFKSLKRDTLNILDEDNIEEYCKGLIEVLKEELGLVVEPKIEALKISKPFGTTYDECLLGLIEMIRDIDLITDRLNIPKPKLFDQVVQNVRDVKITPITVSILHSTNTFFGENFRKYFIPDTSAKTVYLEDVESIRPYLINELLKASKKGEVSVSTPTIKINEV